jgi:branched-chain amino acid transport system substrate-binding protein
MSDLVLERGGHKAGEVYMPLDASWEDYVTLMKRIKALNPDFIFSTVVGDGTALFYRAYRQLGMDPARMPIASLTTSEAEVRQIGREAAEGHITAAPYFQSVDTPANRACQETLRRRFGHDMITNQCWEAAYFQAHLLASAIRRVGSDDVESLLRVLPGSEFDAPQGRVRIDEHNHHTYLRPRIGRVNAAGQFDILEETHHWVRPDPYLISHSLGEWPSRVRAVHPLSA